MELSIFCQIISFESHLHGSLVDYVNTNPYVHMEFKPALRYVQNGVH